MPIQPSIRRRDTTAPTALAGVLLVVVMMLGGLLAPAAARADTSPVTGILTSDTGQLGVAITVPTLWVRVTVLGSDGSALFVTDDLDDRTPDGSWRTDAPVVLPAGTPLGDYEVDVDFRPDSGTTQHWVGGDHGTAGLFPYRVHAAVTGLAFDRTTTTYDNQSAILSGTVTELDPRDRSTSPAPPGTAVLIAWTSRFDYEDSTTIATATATALTDSTGAFQVSIAPHGDLVSGTAVESAPPTGATPSPVPTTPVPLPALTSTATTARLTAGPSHVHLHAGGSFTVSGTLQRLDAGGWHALAGASVLTSTGGQNPYTDATIGLLGRGVSDSRGRFSYRVRATRTTTFSTYLAPSPYLGSESSASGVIDVPTAGSFTRLHITQDVYREAKATGTLHGRCAQQRVSLQYSRTGRSAWSTLASTVAAYASGTSCTFTVEAFGGTDGYYRVTHAESDAMLAVTSPRSARLRRTLTQVVSFSTTPSRPARNATLHATGRLQQRSGSSWRGLGHAHVLLVVRPAGDTQFYLAAKATTDSTGRFTLSSPDYGSGSWGIAYEGDATHFYSESSLRYVHTR